MAPSMSCSCTAHFPGYSLVVLLLNRLQGLLETREHILMLRLTDELLELFYHLPAFQGPQLPPLGRRQLLDGRDVRGVVALRVFTHLGADDRLGLQRRHEHCNIWSQ